MFEEYWEATGVAILNDLWREKWGEYVAGDDDGHQPDCDLPVEELAKLCVNDSKSFVTPDESLDGLDSASDVPRGEFTLIPPILSTCRQSCRLTTVTISDCHNIRFVIYLFFDNIL